ncbi:hypothetical protein CASFOL_022212 [Castilleja foliolosa]|uniref:2Fe-2S ferredoxin-type domain-containing protein n=1 Tax=Castilleja foliolosa TaxID=1961234 RepID=A0ABD3CTX2_9LAMI
MAAMISFSSAPSRPPELFSNHRSPTVSIPRRRPLSVSFASVSSPESSTPPPEKPQIELEFIGPKPGDVVNEATAISGEKLLRSIMLDNKIELYATYGKIMNCGGGGTCGTCIVEIIDGKDLLNERTNTELRYLKKACLPKTGVLEIGVPNYSRE